MRRVLIFAVTGLLGTVGAPGCGDGDGDGDADSDADGDADADADADGDAVVPDEHPRIYVNEENRARLVSALETGRQAATRFAEMVDAQLDGVDHYEFRASDAALMFQLTGEARYAEYAVAMVEARVAGEEALISAGQRAEVAADSYLYVGDVVGEVALVYDWCFDRLTPEQRTRWLAYANQAVWNVWHPEEAAWGGAPHPWSGWSVDNPSNNYYYSFLRATMLLGLAAWGELAEAETWIDTFREAKLEAQLFPAFERDLQGGGSREGTGYGVSMGRLFELYDWWEASTGQRICDRTSHTRASLPAMLHSVVPTLDRLAPVGDHARDSTAALFDYHRRYVQILDWLYRDDPLAAVGAGFLEDCSVPEMGQAFMFLYDFLYDQPALAPSSLSELHPAYHAPGTGQLYFRSSWEPDATWLGFVAGPYTESHAHRDQGSFLLFGREWLADDQNLRSHSGIRQEEQMHNLVRIDRGGETLQMINGGEPAVLTALYDSPEYAYVAVDAAPVYGGEAAIVRDEREALFLKPGVLVLFDRVDAAADTVRVWQLNSAFQPAPSGDVVAFAGATSDLDVWLLGPDGATTSVVDWTTDDDMNGGWRLDVAHSSADGRSRFLHVLSLDGAVSGADAVTDGTLAGVDLVLAGGGTVEVRFESDEVGGTLRVLDGAGSETLSTTLEPGVAVLPVLDEL